MCIKGDLFICDCFCFLLQLKNAVLAVFVNELHACSLTLLALENSVAKTGAVTERDSIEEVFSARHTLLT